MNSKQKLKTLLWIGLKAEQMVQEVKDAFKENLPHLQWMDDETRELAKDKVGQ